MEPSSKSTSGIELPAPMPESAPPASNSGETAPAGGAGPERAPGAIERAPLPKQPSSAAPAVTIPLPVQPTAAVPAPPGGITATVAHGVSVATDDDGDLIEKAWVDKAKQIVERTRDDPHKQSEELTVFKADYMKKRYGKAIKLS